MVTLYTFQAFRSLPKWELQSEFPDPRFNLTYFWLLWMFGKELDNGFLPCMCVCRDWGGDLYVGVSHTLDLSEIIHFIKGKFIWIKMHSNFLKGRERDHLCIGSLLKLLQHSGLGQLKVESQYLNRSLPNGWKGPKYLLELSLVASHGVH